MPATLTRRDTPVTWSIEQTLLPLSNVPRYWATRRYQERAGDCPCLNDQTRYVLASLLSEMAEEYSREPYGRKTARLLRAIRDVLLEDCGKLRSKSAAVLAMRERIRTARPGKGAGR